MLRRHFIKLLPFLPMVGSKLSNTVDPRRVDENLNFHGEPFIPLMDAVMDYPTRYKIGDEVSGLDGQIRKVIETN
jgi:hypothetical protein